MGDNGNLDLFVKMANWFRYLFSPILVVPFFFFSGYGVWESMTCKGEKYLKKFPVQRILTTLLNFDVAVIIFLALSIVMGKRFSLVWILSAFIGWESLGNSNWYIFVILLCYGVAYYSFKAKSVMLLAFIITCIALFLSLVKESWWYSNVLAFPAGSVYSQYKDGIYRWIDRHFVLIILACLGMLGGLYLLPHMIGSLFVQGNVHAIVFCCLLVAFLAKFEFHNSFFSWCGRKLFPIYIYQRLAMICVAEILGGEFVATHQGVFVAICFLLTACIAYFYPYWQIKFDCRVEADK